MRQGPPRAGWAVLLVLALAGLLLAGLDATSAIPRCEPLALASGPAAVTTPDVVAASPAAAQSSPLARTLATCTDSALARPAPAGWWSAGGAVRAFASDADGRSVRQRAPPGAAAG